MYNFFTPTPANKRSGIPGMGLGAVLAKQAGSVFVYIMCFASSLIIVENSLGKTLFFVFLQGSGIHYVSSKLLTSSLSQAGDELA